MVQTQHDKTAAPDRAKIIERIGAFWPGKPDTPADAHLWSPRVTAVLIAFWLVAAVSLTVLSIEAHTHPYFTGDVGIATALQKVNGTVLAPIINISSQLNWPQPAGIIAIALIILMVIVRRFRAALCLVISGFGADLANVVLNSAVARPRPNNVQIHVVANLGLHSFPSGHVTHVISFYGFLLYFCVRGLQAHPNWRPWLLVIQAISVFFIITIGPSRVMLGEHWPSDVLGSYLLGAMMLILAIALYHLLAIAWVRFQAARAVAGG